VLPGVDDGAGSLEEALALCRCAVEDGTRIAVATPHSCTHDAAPRRAPLDPARVAESTAVLQAGLEAAGIPLELLPGMEVAVEPNLLEQTDALVTLAGSRYLLLEMPAQFVPPGMVELAFQLQLAGYVPVIAHPERNQAVIDRPALLYELVSRGCLAQLTAGSLTGAFGQVIQAASEVLLEAGLMHVIASDAHWFPERPTGLSAAVAEATKLVGPTRAAAMVTTTPRAILDDREVVGAPPSLPRRKHRWSLW
jgi:protein-tyrosine phosphatase